MAELRTIKLMRGPKFVHAEDVHDWLEDWFKKTETWGPVVNPHALISMLLEEYDRKVTNEN